ncbi:MAG: signal peptidase I [Clostridia bacterium]|nr:signal peptidase I [Clostridia bacterium]
MKKIKNIIQIVLALILIVLCAFAIVQRTSNNEKGIGGIKIFTVISWSMVPVYDIGDVLIVKEIVPEEIKVDDDIVYKGEKGSLKNKTITHRVVSIDKKEDGNYKIITKGVANRAKDPEISQTQVYGKVIGHISIISFILKIITNGYFLIFIPVIILIRKNIKKLKNMEEG